MDERRYDDPESGLTDADRAAIEARLDHLERNGAYATAAAARERFGLPMSDPWPEVHPDGMDALDPDDPTGNLAFWRRAEAERDEAIRLEREDH